MDVSRWEQEVKRLFDGLKKADTDTRVTRAFLKRKERGSRK